MAIESTSDMQLHFTFVRYMESYKAFKAFSDSQIEGVPVAPCPHPAASNLLHCVAQPCTGWLRLLEF